MQHCRFHADRLVATVVLVVRDSVVVVVCVAVRVFAGVQVVVWVWMCVVAVLVGDTVRVCFGLVWNRIGVVVVVGVLVLWIVIAILVVMLLCCLIFPLNSALIDFGIHLLLHYLKFGLLCYRRRYDCGCRVAMGALLPQPMGMATATMKHKIHADIDQEPPSCHNEHNLGLLDKLLVDNPAGGLNDEEKGHSPYDKEIGNGADNLEPVEAKRLLFVRVLGGVVQKHEAQNKADKVGD